MFAMRHTGAIFSFEFMMETAVYISSGVDHGARGRVILVWHEKPPMRLEGVPVVDDEVDWATHEGKSFDRFRGDSSGRWSVGSAALVRKRSFIGQDALGFPMLSRKLFSGDTLLINGDMIC